MSKVGPRRDRAELDVPRAEPPRFEKVTWYREPHLRKLYAMSLVLMIASSTTGYDGSLINTSQQIQLWEDFFGPDIADNNKLGILVNMFNIGSIVSFFFTPYVADHYGRKMAIIIGCILMICGGCLTAFCNGYIGRLAPTCHGISAQATLTHQEYSLYLRSVRPRLWQFAGTDGIALAAYRNMPSAAPGPRHCDI